MAIFGGINPGENEALSTPQFRRNHNLKMLKCAIFEGDFDAGVSVNKSTHVCFLYWKG